MKREMNLNEVSDGKLYGINDMVKADCQDCVGCSSCCNGMGESIVLDPLDIYRLKKSMNLTFEGLMESYIELNIVDHVILPNLKMNKNSGNCNLLDENGRCSIHVARPGICRIFPLGRIYEKGSFQYFLQINECEKKNRTKIKVSKWIDSERIKENQDFIGKWHYFIKDVEKMIVSGEPEEMKPVSMYVLNLFYVKVFEENEDFYAQMRNRMIEAREALGL